MKIFRRSISILLSLLIVSTLFTIMPLSVEALNSETYKVVCKAGVKLRSSYSTGSTAYMTLTNGTTFTVTEKYKSGGYYWGKTTYKGYTGWTALLKTDHSEIYSQVTGTYYHSLHTWVGSDTSGTVANSPYYCGTKYYFWAELTDPFFKSQTVLLTDVMPELTVNLTFSVTGPASFSSSITYNNSCKKCYAITPGSTAGTFTCNVRTSGDAGNAASVSFTVNSYTIWFDANGGSCSTSSKSVTNGSTYGSLPTPSRTGCTFDGWYTFPNGGVSVTSSSRVKLSANQTFYAHWTDNAIPTCSISSSNNVASLQTVTLSLSDNVGIAGYYWGTSSNYRNNTFSSTSSTSITKTISSPGTYYLTAKDSSGNVSTTQSITFYQTTLNANGETRLILTKSGNSFTPPTPTKTGFTFAGWSTSSTATTGSTSITPTSNTTYYAIWKDATNPSCSISSTNNVASSQTVTLTLSDNAGIAGYYWGTSSSYSNNDFSSISSTSITKIVYEPGTYYLTAKDSSGNVSTTQTITFYQTTLNANGGTASQNTVLTKSGNSFTPTAPTRSGYTFAGWSTSSTATTGSTSITPTSNTTYYAVWKDATNPSCSISSTNNVASSQTVTLSLSDNAGIAGYYWGTSSNYSNNTFSSTSSTSITKTVSEPGTYYLTAKDTSGNVSTTQSITFYQTTLNANGGTASQNTVLTKSGNSFTPPTPTRSGYTFAGWSTSSTATTGLPYITPTSSSTYYAVWFCETISLNESKTVNISTAGDVKYYQFIPSKSGTYEIYSSGVYDTYGYLYDSNMNELTYNDDGGTGSNFKISYSLTGGRKYIIGAKFYSSSNTGSFTVTVNDGTGSATEPTEPTYLETESSEPTAESTESTESSYETISLNESKTVNISTAGDVKYYQFTPSKSGTYEIYSSGVYDTYGYLYDSNMNQLTYNDDGGTGSNFKISYSLTGGRKYIIGAKLYSLNSTGSFAVTVTDGTGSATEPTETTQPTTETSATTEPTTVVTEPVETTEPTTAPTQPTTETEPTETTPSTTESTPVFDYYVVGDKILFGAEWTETPANGMTQGIDGYYYLAIKNAPAGTFNFKIKDSSGKWYPDGMGNEGVVTTTGGEKIIFRYDPKEGYAVVSTDGTIPTYPTPTTEPTETIPPITVPTTQPTTEVTQPTTEPIETQPKPTAPPVCRHNSTWTRGKKSATYFTKGYTGDKVCNSCGKVVSKGRSVAKILATPKAKIKSRGNSIVISYTKVKGAQGFEMECKFGSKKYSQKIKTTKSKTITLRNIKRGIKATVKIRAFTTSGKKKAYSNWTKAKTLQIK